MAMEDVKIRQILVDSYTNEKTREQYLARLVLLKKVCDGASYYTIIANPDLYYQMLRTRYPNISMRKNMLTLILAIFRNSDNVSSVLGAQRKRWKKFHDDMDGFQEAKYARNMPDVKQLVKYTPMEEIKLKYEELKRGDPHATRQSSQHFLLLSIIINTPPKRSDYGSMKVYRNKDPNLKDANYLVLHTDSQTPSYMVFTVFKTAKTYTRVDEVLNRQLYKDVSDSLRRHPRQYLFVNRFGEPFATNHLYSQYVSAAFEKMFGRKTGVSMLRHIYITEELDFNDLSLEERSDIAKQMLHSKGLQEKYAWNKKKVCEAMKSLCDDCKDSKVGNES
jgi:hypothetical protein